MVGRLFVGASLRLAVLALSLCPISSVADTRAMTADGRTVILRDDGTWVFEGLVGASQAPPTPPPAEPSCSDSLIKHTDKVSGQSYISSEIIVVSTDEKTGMSLHAFSQYPYSENGVIWTINMVGGPTCIDDDDKMNILFKDGTRLELENDSKFNCDGKFTVYFGGVFGKKAEKTELATKDIATLRVWGRGDYLQRDLTDAQAKTFRRAMACLPM